MRAVGDGPCNFEPRSSDEDDTRVGTYTSNFPTNFVTGHGGHGCEINRLRLHQIIGTSHGDTIDLRHNDLQKAEVAVDFSPANPRPMEIP
ncbi:hypothetical protein TNCV_4451961 [Trichonephila clavipes]|nr:hypothetical protein TNCV_4451961 [Trichonephila clavipes]